MQGRYCLIWQGQVLAQNTTSSLTSDERQIWQISDCHLSVFVLCNEGAGQEQTAGDPSLAWPVTTPTVTGHGVHVQID